MFDIFDYDSYSKKQLWNLLIIFTKALKIALRNRQQRGDKFWHLVNTREKIIQKIYE